MKNDKLVSFLVPVRGHPNLCMDSFRSIIENATDTIPYEVLIAIDNDDEEILKIIPQIHELFSNTQNGECQIIITPRYYYYGLNKYYNHLASISKGELLCIWNSDCIMLNSHLHQPGINQDHTLSNWDIVLKQDLENIEKDILLLFGLEIYFGNDERHLHSSVGGGAFPILLRKTYEILGHVSMCPRLRYVYGKSDTFLT